MKKYVFMTYGLSEIGGVELYILNKSKWLEKNGYHVHVITAISVYSPFKIEGLRKYENEVLPLLYYPPYYFSKNQLKKICNKVLSLIGDFGEKDNLIIESHTGTMALWGELIASTIKCKHVVDMLNEDFSELAYVEKKDFFLYKMSRLELYGPPTSFDKLFGKNNYDSSMIRSFKLQENPVSDYKNKIISTIESSDYNIAYIGRTNKPYMENIVNGVISFAAHNPNKTVSFVVVGDLKGQNSLFNRIAQETNIRCYFLGDVFPIPMDLFKIIDVSICGSGSARCSASQGVMTIVADPITCKSSGVLGYDTFSSLGQSEQGKYYDFDYMLDLALCKEFYNKKPLSVPKSMTVEECCEQNIAVLTESFIKSKQDYYDKELITLPRCDLLKRLKALLLFLFPKLFVKIILK